MTTDARRVALVTGARGGIGRAVVDRMRADGIRVAAFDRTPAEDESSPDVLHLCGDVVDERAVAEAVTTTVERFGRIDCVVAIAGINYRARIHEADLRRWGDVLSTNVVGMTTVLKHAVPHLRERTGSSIVLMGSIAAWLGSDGYSAYTASKAAVHGLAVALAQELAPRIRVCAVAPGWVETPFSVQGLTLESDPATARVEAEQAHALQRFARPSEIAETIAFLASERSSFMTGTVVRVDGGFMVMQ